MKHDALNKEIIKSIAVILPSEWYENNPMAILEAFALGKPVIGSKIGGIPELVEDYERGLTFEANNPEDLISKIQYLVDNPEKGLEMGGYYLYQLTLWLAPLEESQGRIDMALLAYHAAYDESPSIEIYRQIKRLSGENWLNIQPALIQKVTNNNAVSVDIHLDERDWDAAIKVVERDSWSFQLLEKVADAVVSYRPDWVIRVSLKQSDRLIAQAQSKYYPIAAGWLERAKQAYHQKGRDAEWQAYIDNLRMTYARRPALQREIRGL